MPRRHKTTNYPEGMILLLVLLLVGLGVGSQLPRIQNLDVLTWVFAGVVTVVAVLLLGFLAWQQYRKVRALQIADIDSMTGRDFEEYLAKLLKGQGFQDISVTKVAGDFGADLIALRAGIKYAVQAKRYTLEHMVGVEALYQCFGGQRYYKCDESMVITNSYFTEAAKELAKESKAVLVDRDELVEWILKFQAKK